jgi:hypothetical protein
MRPAEAKYAIQCSCCSKTTATAKHNQKNQSDHLIDFLTV